MTLLRLKNLINKMDAMFLLLPVLCCIRLQHVTAERIEATAPVSPVEEGSILSLHCRVWDLNPSNSVFLFRETISGVQQLSMNKNVQVTDNYDIFLADRQLTDGTIVYFLTIIDVKRYSDEGKYTCKVMSETLSHVIAEESVDIAIQYFPDDTFPVCGVTTATTVQAGTNIVFNCSSDSANPTVNIKWSQSGVTLQSRTVTRDGTSYSTLKFIAKSSDNGAIFICTISSPAFPDQVRTCHVGPLTVRGNAGNSAEYPRASKPSTISSNFETDIIETQTKTDLINSCATKCSVFSSSSMYWVLATVIAVFFAILFCVSGIALYVKYRRVHNEQRQRQLTLRQQAVEDVYEKIEYRPGQPTLYMPLDKASKLDTLVVNSPSGGHYEDKPGVVVPQYYS